MRGLGVQRNRPDIWKDLMDRRHRVKIPYIDESVNFSPGISNMDRTELISGVEGYRVIRHLLPSTAFNLVELLNHPRLICIPY